MKRLEIELSFGLSAPVHCPGCGAIVLDGEHAPGYTLVCDHVVFFYIHEVGEFGYVAKAYENLLESAKTLKGAMKRLDRPSMFALSLTTGGMACGPVWSTATLGFDLAPETAEGS